jgi:recombination protein RecT
MNDVATRANPVAIFKKTIDEMEGQFRAALPRQISSEKFVRVALTAVQINPKILKCSLRSVFNALLRCANDGLLPDGREAAITEGFGTGEAVYMPMRAGIMKKARNSGEIAKWEVHVVHANDEFKYKLGDSAELTHEPALDDPGPMVRAYSICHLTSGEVSREVMSKAEIEGIRDRYSAGWKAFQANKIRSTPWADAPGEMWKKTVLKRHAKSLPVSSEVSGLLDYDNTVENGTLPALRGRPPKAIEAPTEPKDIDETFGDGERDDPPHDPDTGEVITDEVAKSGQAYTDALNDPTGDKAGELLASKLEGRAKMGLMA